MAIPSKRLPRRGEIWFVKLHVDPPDKGLRPVLIVSVDARNQHERADTVLAVPLTTSVHKEVPTHIVFRSAETGLSSDSAARASASLGKPSRWRLAAVREESLQRFGRQLGLDDRRG